MGLDSRGGEHSSPTRAPPDGTIVFQSTNHASIALSTSSKRRTQRKLHQERRNTVLHEPTSCWTPSTRIDSSHPLGSNRQLCSANDMPW